MSELKPCPFCGRTPIVDDCGDHRFFVRCKCGINQDKLYAQKCDAVRAWNRRKKEDSTTDAEPTEEQVKEYCRKRGLVIVNSELFNEMKARWSAEPVKHGHWKETPYTDYDDTYECSVCGATWTFIEGTPKDNGCDYCPHCGARMDE